MRSFIAYHQLLGGALGILATIYYLVFAGLSIIMSIPMLLIFFISVMAGWRILKNQDCGEEFSIFNYFLQTINFGINGSVSLIYSLVGSIRVGLSFEDLGCLINFDIISGLSYSFDFSGTDFVMINFTSFIALWYLLAGGDE